jgi:hypothetical protein
MDTSTLTKAFNILLFHFLDDIISIFPDKKEIQIAKKSFQTIKQMNTTALIKCWNQYVYLPYRNHIDDGDISFFVDKDYRDDLVYLQDSDEIMKMIDSIREPIREMGEENMKISTKYIQQLSNISYLYSRKK